MKDQKNFVSYFLKYIKNLKNGFYFSIKIRNRKKGQNEIV